MGDHEPHQGHEDHDDHELSYYEKRIIALSNLLMDKGIISSQDLLNVLDEMDHEAPMVGAKVVARAWMDADFKQRLFQDGNLAMAEMGITLRRFKKLQVVENTGNIHNVVVCTLCSCYPISLLGQSPDWYKDELYRSWVVDDPRECLKDLGVDIHEDVKIKVWDSTAEVRYLVLPQRPKGTENLTEDQLAQIITRDSMIGVGWPLDPSAIAAVPAKVQ